MLHLNEKSLADFVQQATSDNLIRQSHSEIVILTNMDPVEWMSTKQQSLGCVYFCLTPSESLDILSKVEHISKRYPSLLFVGGCQRSFV